MQTKDRTSSLDFPTPPPAIADATEFSGQAPDEYLSLKVHKRDSTALYSDVHNFSIHSFIHLPLLFSSPHSINPCQQELDRVDRLAETPDRTQKCEQQKTGDTGRDEEGLEKEHEKEKQQFNQELNVLGEKAKRLRDSKISRKCKCTPTVLWQY